MQLNDFLASENGPPWLPASVAEARKLMYFGQLIALIFALIALIVGVFMVITGNLAGIGSLVAAALGLIVVYMLKNQVFSPLDQGKFKQASDALLIWFIVGLIVYLIPGVILLLGYLKLQDIFQQPQYNQYQAQQYQVAPTEQPAQPAPAQEHPAPAQPAPAQPTSAEEHKEKKVEMIKCRKCGVNFPTFMHNCPNCNEPKH
ncbi:MAG: hypothetical protein NT131_02275 [Methanomassiliicoccales archaeon]|nr:hypothetical protein [Methanomassiliicoccales archaeon]